MAERLPTQAAIQIRNDEPALLDSLGRGAYVRALSQVLRSCETPLVVGLYGSWGAGKTSLLMQLRASLLESGQYRAVWYDPWQHQFDDHPAVALLQATYDQLSLGKNPKRAKQIKALVVGISYALAKSAMSHVPIVGSDLRTAAEEAGKIVESMRSQELEQAFQRRELQQHLHESFTEFVKVALQSNARDGRIPERLFFFIDDLDRCTPDRVVSLLESLKLFLNVPQCVFVLGLDREPIEAAIRQQYSWAKSSQAEYLDKIIQLELVIPPVALTTREAFVRNSLASVFGDAVTSNAGTPLIRDVVRLLALGIGGNPRQLKRAVGSFSLMHLLGSELVPKYRAERLALALLVQHKSPDLFRSLSVQPERITELVSQAEDTDGSTEEVGELYRQYVAGDYEFAKAIQFAESFIDGDLLPYLQLAEPGHELGPEYYLPEILDLHRRYIEGQSDGQRAILDGAALNGVILHDCNLSSASFVATNLDNADLSGSDFGDADLSKSSAEKANFSGSQLVGMTAAALRARGANFSDCVIVNANLESSDLVEATFANAQIKGCKFRGSRMDRSVFTGSTIEGLDWTLVRSAIGVDFFKARLIDCNFSGARIESSSFRAVSEWIACKLTGADFSGCDLREAVLEGMDLSDSRLVGAQIMGANLRQAVLCGANLRSARLDRSYLHGADLSDVFLDEASMVQTQAPGANFCGASLRRVNLLGAHLQDADFSGAIMNGAMINDDLVDWIRWDEHTVWPDGTTREVH